MKELEAFILMITISKHIRKDVLLYVLYIYDNHSFSDCNI